MRHLNRTRIALLVASTVLLSSAAGAQAGLRSTDLGRQHVRAVEARYARDTWAATTPRDGIPITGLGLDGWRAGQLRAAGTLLTVPFYPAQGEAARPTFLVEARVAATVASAQDTLIEWLASVQNPTAMPAASERGVAVGDVAFLGPSGAGQNASAWIAFVRGNVAVRLLALETRELPGFDLGTIARSIDAALQTRPALAPGGALSRTRIERLKATPTSVQAGERVELDVELSAPAAAQEWIVGGPGQGYVERAADGRLSLHTTAAGTIGLQLRVIAANGTLTQQTVTLEVSDD